MPRIVLLVQRVDKPNPRGKALAWRRGEIVAVWRHVDVPEPLAESRRDQVFYLRIDDAPGTFPRLRELLTTEHVDEDATQGGKRVPEAFARRTWRVAMDDLRAAERAQIAALGELTVTWNRFKALCERRQFRQRDIIERKLEDGDV